MQRYFARRRRCGSSVAGLGAGQGIRAGAVKNYAREAREIFSAKGAITGWQIVVPHCGFGSG